MHAYLVTGNNQNLIQERVLELLNKLKVKRLDFALQKIADVRELGKFTNLALNEKTAIVIENFDGAGEEAQNAFLKNLEEPQENLIYILTAKNEDSVLPTIASRCELIELRSMNYELSMEDRRKIKEFMSKTVGGKLDETSRITKRNEAIAFMKDVLIHLHNELKNDSSLAHSIEVADQTLRNLEHNGSVQIQLTNFVVNSN